MTTCIRLKPPGFAQAPFNRAIAKRQQKTWAAYIGVPVEWTSPIGMKFVLIPPGEFTMGDPANAESFAQERILIPKAFYMGVYPVTKEEYAHYCPRPDGIDWEDKRKPVVDCCAGVQQSFCKSISTPEDGTYRLPSEEEWEYACRAGNQGDWSFGDDEIKLYDYGWYRVNSRLRAHRVGEKRPNAWGLYDMHGNVWERCTDRYSAGIVLGAKSTAAQTRPREARRWIYRGGSWVDDGVDCRSASRYASYHELGEPNCGFRVVREL